MEGKIPYARGAIYQSLRNGSSRPRANSASDFLESPGKKYPRLCILFTALTLFCFISWLPYLTEKPKGPIAFVWPSNQSRNARQLVQPDKVTNILSPSNICSSNSSQSDPYLLVIICSAVENFEARDAIRNSWAQDQNKNKRVLFLVGQLVNGSHQSQLVEESENHGDLIQEGFMDSYANLTVKSIMLLKWFTQNCDNGAKSQAPQYVLKTDDDMYINLEKLYDIVRTNKKPNLLLGSLICNAIPIKDPYNKWYVPNYMFSERRYPNYLSGTAYLMHRDIIPRLYKASLDTPIFHLEDIYITGVLSRKIQIKPVDNIGFSYVRRKLNSCLFRQTVTTHHVKHAEMKAIHNKLKSTKNVKCAPIRARLLREYGPGKCKWPKATG